MSNIQDVTNSAKDWEDFWYNEDKDLKPKSKSKDRLLPNYLQDIIEGKTVYRRPQSPLSE